MMAKSYLLPPHRLLTNFVYVLILYILVHAPSTNLSSPHAYIRTHARSHTHTHAHMHTHARTNARTHKYFSFKNF